MDSLTTGKPLANLLDLIPPAILAALADVIVSAAVLNVRKVVLHEADAMALQERSSKVVQQLRAVIPLSNDKMEQLDNATRNAAAPMTLRRSAEVYRNMCGELFNPLLPLVGLLYKLHVVGVGPSRGYGAALRCALANATDVIAQGKCSGTCFFGALERFITIDDDWYNSCPLGASTPSPFTDICPAGASTPC